MKQSIIGHQNSLINTRKKIISFTETKIKSKINQKAPHHKDLYENHKKITKTNFNQKKIILNFVKLIP